MNGQGSCSSVPGGLAWLQRHGSARRNPLDQRCGLGALDAVVADQQLPEQRLVDLPSGDRVAAPVELPEVMEKCFQVDQILHRALEGLVEVPGLVFDALQGLLDPFDLGSEQVRREPVVVVELKQLGALGEQLVPLLVEPCVVGMDPDLALSERLLDQFTQFADLMGVQRHGVVEALDDERMQLCGRDFFALMLSPDHGLAHPRHSAALVVLLLQPEVLFSQVGITGGDRRSRFTASARLAFSSAGRTYHSHHELGTPKAMRVIVDDAGVGVRWWDTGGDGADLPELAT